MSESDVTRDGVRGARPSRDALTGADDTARGWVRGQWSRSVRAERGRRGGNAEGRRGRLRRRRGGGGAAGYAGGERTDRPGGGGDGGAASWSDGEGVHGGRRRRSGAGAQVRFTSYYGRPVLKEPVWEARDIAGYFFFGGLAGASSVLAAGADATGRPALARAGKIAAVTGISVSVAALIHDLGRPERFLNMLRVCKPSSPMSVGSWLLAGYGPAAGLAAFTAVTGRFPSIGRAATTVAAAIGPAVAAYTAPLISNTAVPAWHEGRRELPYLFVGSAAAAAGGFGMLAAPVRQAGPARHTAAAGAAMELVALTAMRRRLGMVAEPYRQGHAARLLRTAETLSLGGALGGAVLGRTSRLAAVTSGAALLTASALVRFGVFEAGCVSARDPKYTVVPQRSRLHLTAQSPYLPSS